MRLELRHRLRVTLAADDPRVADGNLVNYAPRAKGCGPDEVSDIAEDFAQTKGGFREVWLEPGTILDISDADGSWCIERLPSAIMLAENANRANRAGAMFPGVATATN